MVGYGGTHSIELLRKPSAEYDHDENTTLRVLWTCTKKTSLMFYRVKLLAKLTLLVMLGGVDNIETRCKRRAPENYPFLDTRCGGHPLIKICM